MLAASALILFAAQARALASRPRSSALLLSWSANYYQPQSLELVARRATSRASKGLSYDRLTSFGRDPDPAVVVWMREGGRWAHYERSEDYRLAFRASEGWFLVNRFGFSLWKGKSSAFDVGAFLQEVRRDRDEENEDLLTVRFSNRTTRSVKLFAVNGVPIGDLGPRRAYVWHGGWSTAVIARRGLNDIGLLVALGGRGGPFSAIPRLPSVNVRVIHERTPRSVAVVIGP